MAERWNHLQILNASRCWRPLHPPPPPHWPVSYKQVEHCLSAKRDLKKGVPLHRVGCTNCKSVTTVKLKAVFCPSDASIINDVAGLGAAFRDFEEPICGRNKSEVTCGKKYNKLSSALYYLSNKVEWDKNSYTSQMLKILIKKQILIKSRNPKKQLKPTLNNSS